MTERSRPMKPEFDPFPLPVPDRPREPPILVGYVEGEEGTEVCTSSQHMADVFRSPVYVPQMWPVGATIDSRIVVRPGSLRAERDRHYLVVVRLPEWNAPLLVYGYFGASPYQEGDGGCGAVAELREVGGIVHEGPGSIGLSVRYGALCVLLMNFPTRQDAIAAASSLELLTPAGS